MTVLFPPELRTASVVPRWSIVWTLTKDYVSNHSFFVAFYSHQIAKLIEWRGDYGALMYRALTHDLDETITGDLVSPVKSEILDEQRAAAYIDKKMRERLATVVDETEQIKNLNNVDKIVKVADRLDALLFLVIEKRLGNNVIEKQIPMAWDNLVDSWRKLWPWAVGPSMGYADFAPLWKKHIVQAVQDHETRGGLGV